MARNTDINERVLENYIYIYHLDKFCVLPTMPDSISDTMATRFEQASALSRSAPVQSYIQSGPRTVNFTLDLHRDIMEDLNTGVSNLKDNVVDFSDKDYIDVLLNYLQACAVPKYNIYKTGSKAVIPPQVAVRMGNDIFVRGIINSQIGVTYQKPILDNNKYAKVQVTFAVTEVDPYDAPTIRDLGGFRGITAMFKNGIYKDKEVSTTYNNINKNSTSDTTLEAPKINHYPTGGGKDRNMHTKDGGKTPPLAAQSNTVNMNLSDGGYAGQQRNYYNRDGIKYTNTNTVLQKEYSNRFTNSSSTNTNQSSSTIPSEWNNRSR